MPGSPSSGEDYSEMDTITSPDSYVNLSVIGNGSINLFSKIKKKKKNKKDEPK